MGQLVFLVSIPHIHIYTVGEQSDQPSYMQTHVCDDEISKNMCRFSIVRTFAPVLLGGRTLLT